MPDDHQIGDQPIEERYREQMQQLGRVLDMALNGEGERETGFVLLVFPLGDHEGRCNYLSNANREDIVLLLKEQLARFQGQPEMKGRA